MKLYAIIITCLLITSCNQESKNNDNDLVLVTIETKTPEKPTSELEKVKYIYFAQLADDNNVCNGKLKDTIAFKEVWRNDYPEYPGSWQQISKEKIAASEAKNKGCEMQDGVKSIIDMQKFPDYVLQYYSEDSKY